MWKPAIALAILAGAALPAHANDSSAELSTGGLIFVQNPDVEMRSEDLFISAREVHVRYRFFNSSPRDVTVLVAFPMPEIQVHGPDEIISVPTEDPENFLAFTTTVNGQPVATNVEQRVTAVGIDRTQLLRSLAVPLAPHLPDHERGARPAARRQMAGLPAARHCGDRGIRYRTRHAEASGAALGVAHHLLLGTDLPGAGRSRHRAPLQAERRRDGADRARRAEREHGAVVRGVQGEVLPRRRIPGDGRPRAPRHQQPRRRALQRTAHRLHSEGPAPTGRGRSGTSAWWWTKASPTAWSASAARTSRRSATRSSKCGERTTRRTAICRC